MLLHVPSGSTGFSEFLARIPMHLFEVESRRSLTRPAPSRTLSMSRPPRSIEVPGASHKAPIPAAPGSATSFALRQSPAKIRQNGALAADVAAQVRTALTTCGVCSRPAEHARRRGEAHRDDQGQRGARASQRRMARVLSRPGTTGPRGTSSCRTCSTACGCSWRPWR